MKGTLVALPIDGMPMIREISIVHQDDFDHPEILEDIRTIYDAMRS